MKYNLFIYLLLSFQIIQYIEGVEYESAWDIIAKVEKQVQLGAERASELYGQRCNFNNSKCINQSYDICSIYIPDDMETIHKEIQADGCKKPGINVNPNTSGGRCSTEIPCDTDNDKILICSQGALFDDYRIHKKDGESYITSLRHTKDDMIIYQYAGYINSFWKVYPFYHQAFECGECTDYDPRARAWYVSGITGKKNLILIIDISESMTIKMKRMKNAVSTVVKTLGYNDWFQIIFYNNVAKTVDGGDVLIQATSKNKEKILSKIEDITESGGDNFEDAFKLAFQVMDNTDYENLVSFDCMNVIQFMTDGVITEGEKNQNKIIDMVTSLNKKYNSSIFAYAFGSDADQVITQGIACNNKGLSYFIDEDSDTGLLIDMSNYYIELALEIEQSEIIWSEIYKSSSLKVEMITGTAPIFYKSSSGDRKLLGVYGADLLIEQLNEYSDFESEVLPNLLARGRELCIDSDINDCKLDMLRQQTCYTPESFKTQCPDTVPYSVKTCTKDVENGWQKEEDGSLTGEYVSICEGTTSSDFRFCWQWWHFVLIAISSLLIIFLVVYAIRWYLQKKQREKEIKYGLETQNTER